MFCINCFKPKTQVVNTRTKSKRPSIWRRRACSSCGYIFSTYERPAHNQSQLVLNQSSQSNMPALTSPFNLGRLIISISTAFQHDQIAAKTDSLMLAETVEEILLTEQKQISNDDIAAVTHQVLKRYDKLAAVQYAARHQLLTSKRRQPGRPPQFEI